MKIHLPIHLSTFNIQLVCNNDNKITNDVAEWPETTHYSCILDDKGV